MELDFHSFSMLFPHFIHTLNTLWNTLVFSSDKISKLARMNRFDYKNVIVDIFIWTKLWQTLDLYIFVSVIFQQVTLVYIQEHSSQSLFPSIREHHSYEHNSNFR